MQGIRTGARQLLVRFLDPIGWTITFTLGLVTVVLGLIRFTLGLLTLGLVWQLPNPVPYMSWLWASFMKQVAYGLLGIEVVLEIDIPDIKPDDQFFVVASHGRTWELPGQVWGMTQLRKLIIPVAKLEHALNPMGWGLKATGLVVFINRANNASAVRALKRTLRWAFKKGDLMFIFSDGTRPTMKKVVESWKEMRDKVKQVMDFRYTVVPRPAGTFNALRNLPSHVRILRCVCTFDVYGQDLKNPRDLQGCKLYVRFTEIRRRDIPRDYPSFKEWLYELFRGMNKEIGTLRTRHIGK